jgi:integrase
VLKKAPYIGRANLCGLAANRTRAVLAKAGIRRQRFHDLQHAFATLQLETGAELFDVSRALGHADIGTTANVYAHFTEAMADRMADRMAGILGAATPSHARK